MAFSCYSRLGAKTITRWIAAAAVLFTCASLHAQELKSYILATRRGGAIEIVDPTSLATVGRIHFALNSEGAELNGASASADGTTLYVEGPLPNDPKGCCALYSIDLATLQTKQVADVRGTSSRAAFVTSDGTTYQAAALGGAAEIKGMMRWDQMHLSPDGRSIFGVTPFPGGALDIYDRAQGKVLRYLIPARMGERWWPNGIWMDDHFLFYAAKDDGSAARLWSVTPDTTELGEGVAVEPFAQVPGCSSYVEAGLTAAPGGSLFLYEMFGWKLDRRTRCQSVPGGAWLVDPASGRLLRHIAPQLYFSELIADRHNAELYGLSVGDANWRSRVKLVRIDARDGSVLQSRDLDADFWRITVVPLRNVPAADVRALTEPQANR